MRGVRFERIGTGQIGRSYRLSLDVAPGDALPPTLVLKIAAGDPEARQLVNRGFEKEVRFYQDIQAHTAVNTPQCWFAAISDDLNSFVLLLDDLAPRVPGRQADGCSYAQATAAVVEPRRDCTVRCGASALLDEHAALARPDDAAGAEFLGRHHGTARPSSSSTLYRDRLSAQDRQTLTEAPKPSAPWAAMERERSHARPR